MLKKSAVIARENPFLFFMVVFLGVLLVIVSIAVAIFAITNYTSVISDKKNMTLIVSISYAPIIPFFIFFSLMFAEWFLNLFGVARLLGLHEKPILKLYLRWCGVKPENLGDQNG